MRRYEQEPAPTTAAIRIEEHLDARTAAAGVVHARFAPTGDVLLDYVGRPVLDSIGQALIERLKKRLR